MIKFVHKLCGHLWHGANWTFEHPNELESNHNFITREWSWLNNLCAKCIWFNSQSIGVLTIQDEKSHIFWRIQVSSQIRSHRQCEELRDAIGQNRLRNWIMPFLFLASFNIYKYIYFEWNGIWQQSTVIWCYPFIIWTSAHVNLFLWDLFWWHSANGSHRVSKRKMSDSLTAHRHYHPTSMSVNAIRNWIREMPSERINAIRMSSAIRYFPFNWQIARW